jgi:hypothetical protein
MRNSRNIFLMLILVGISNGIVYAFFREAPASKFGKKLSDDIKPSNNRCTVVFLTKDKYDIPIPSNCYRLMLGSSGCLADESGNLSHDMLRSHLSNESQQVVNISILAHIDIKLIVPVHGLRSVALVDISIGL